VLAGAVLFWLSLFLSKFRFIPLGVGFDAPAHLVYVEYLLERGSLPTAAYGFSTYHPPLFYLLTAALHGIFGAGTAVYHAIPFLSGLSNIGLTAWLARRLWPDQALRPSLAIGAAALLPMNLYMSAYVSNEPLHASVVGGCIALATGILLSSRVKLRHLIALGLALAAALLTKFTSLALAPVIAFFVGLRAW
jgi:4-amino-4-deoxy-L-arabinose transferase-like glycosyltransferase